MHTDAAAAGGGRMEGNVTLTEDEDEVNADDALVEKEELQPEHAQLQQPRGEDSKGVPERLLSQ